MDKKLVAWRVEQKEACAYGEGMRYFLSVLLTLLWALWIGGQATLVLLIMTLFFKDRATAVKAGPIMFPAFERYQLVLASVAIAVCALLAVFSQRKMFVGILVFFILAAAGGLISRTVVTPKMVGLWNENRSEGPEFNALHRKSQLLYNSEFVLLLVAGSMIPAATRSALGRGA